MKLGKVIGTVVATRKDEKLEGLQLYMVQDISPEAAPREAFVVAVDSVGAGVGEVVLYASGSSARQTRATDGRPVDAVIMAIVDTVDMQGRVTYHKADEDGAPPSEGEGEGAASSTGDGDGAP